MKDHDEFDDIYDDDEDLEDIPDIDDLLESHNMNIETADAECKKYISEFDDLVKRIGCSVKDKFNICEKTAELLEKGKIKKDDLALCYAMLSVFSDILFKEESDDEVRIASYLKLTDEAEMRMRYYKEQEEARSRFRKLCSKINRSETPVGEIDFRKLQRSVYNLGFRGEQLENNLRVLTEIIVHSKELYGIAPLIYYSALMRNTNKMQSKADYEPNIKALLKREEYGIDSDNGKNINTMSRHINVISGLTNDIGGDNVWLQLIGFDEICNIMQCELIDWDDMKDLRPVRVQMEEDAFSVFVNGAADNPFYTNFDEYLDEMTELESIHSKITESINRYICSHQDVIEKYEDMLKNDTSEKCMPLINEVINGSDIDITGISANKIPSVYCYIMRSVMEGVSEHMHQRLIRGVLENTLEKKE